MVAPPGDDLPDGDVRELHPVRSEVVGDPIGRQAVGGELLDPAQCALLLGHGDQPVLGVEP